MPTTAPQEPKKVRRFSPELNAIWEWFPRLAKVLNLHTDKLKVGEPLPDLPELQELLWRMQELLGLIQARSQATFVTVKQEPSLANSRYLFAGDNITLTDQGKLAKLIVAAAGAAAASNCGSLDTSIEGGLVGTHLNSASPGATAVIGTPYAGTSTTAKWMPQSRYCLSGPMAAMSAAGGGGQFGMIFWNTKDQASTVLTVDPKATVMPPGAAAGAFVNADVVFYSQAYQYYSFTGSGTLGGSGAVQGVASKVLGTTVQPLGNYLSLSTRGAGTTSYSGPGQGNTAAVTNEDLVIVPVPFACTMKNAAIITGGTQPGTGSFVATFRDDKADTALVLTVPAGGLAGVRIDHTNQISVAAHSALSIKEVNNAAGASATIDGYHFELVPTDGSVKALIIFPMYSRVLTAAASRYAPGFFNNGLQATEAIAWTPIPYATATMRYLDVYVQAAPANDLVITVMKNGVATAVTGTVTSGFAAPGVFQIDAGSAVALVSGDRVSVEFASGAGGVATISGCGLEIDS